MRKELILAGMLTALSVTSVAQAETVEVSSEQAMLSNQATEATLAGDYKKAEQLFTAMLQLGEIDFVWMQLGRTYDTQGKCLEARYAYEHVEDAPDSDYFTHDAIIRKTQQFADELREKCSAKVVLECVTPNMLITVDGGKEFACHTNTMYLTPGSHAIYAKTDFGFNTLRADAVAGEVTTVPVEVIDYEAIAANGGLTPEEKAKRSLIFKSVGWSLFGGGLAAMAFGFSYWGVAYFDYKADAECAKKHPSTIDVDCGGKGNAEVKAEEEETYDKQYIGGGVAGAGGALFLAGLALIIVDAIKYSDNGEDEASSAFVLPAPYINEDGAGLGLTFRF